MSRSLYYCSSLPAATQVALRRAGYETVDDLLGVSAETLSKELGIDIADSQALISATQAPKGPPLSQSVASLSRTNLIECSHLAVNKILGGGLPRGHILEISGPPGSFKETLALDFVRTFAKAEERVIFVDMQGMTSPKAISAMLAGVPSASSQELIRYARFHTLPDILIFMRNLPAELRPATRLLVLNSISFPFQSHPDLRPSRRAAILGIIRQTLLQACVSSNLTIVVTSQMATKMLSADGSAASFDTGARAVMMPQLGPDYLPSGRSYRLVVIPHSRVAG
ncbi:P-loop containing nucleoside triphosphate hydrolase protein [Tylopilus felleus]